MRARWQVKGEVVEAVGIEPTSEKVQQSKTTCVSASNILADGSEAARGRQPSLIDLGLSPSGGGVQPSPLNDVPLAAGGPATRNAPLN